MIKFLVSGHVDHGKSTLCGHLLNLVGAIDERSMNKIAENASQSGRTDSKYAFAMDLYEEERDRGMTIDVNKVEFTYNGRNYEMLDTPGHKNFIRNLLEGINSMKGGSLTGVIVVSGVGNEFESGFIKNGQTKEDMILLRASGIENIIICINKMDKTNWNKEQFLEQKNILSKFARGLKYKNIAFVATSGWTGDGLIAPGKTVGDFPCLMDAITNFAEYSTGSNNIGEKEIETRKIKCAIQILSCENIITVGWEGILHISSGEYRCQFTAISPRILRQSNNGVAIITSELPMKIKKDDRIILRNGDRTVGYGKIM